MVSLLASTRRSCCCGVVETIISFFIENFPAVQVSGVEALGLCHFCRWQRHYQKQLYNLQMLDSWPAGLFPCHWLFSSPVVTSETYETFLCLSHVSEPLHAPGLKIIKSFVGHAMKSKRQNSFLTKDGWQLCFE